MRVEQLILTTAKGKSPTELVNRWSRVGFGVVCSLCCTSFFKRGKSGKDENNNGGGGAHAGFFGFGAGAGGADAGDDGDGGDVGRGGAGLSCGGFGISSDFSGGGG